VPDPPAADRALHVVQPIARLRGRLQEGLTPWRRRATLGLGPLWPITTSIWSERWEAQEQRLRALEERLRAQRACVLRGQELDDWDLEVRAGSSAWRDSSWGSRIMPAGSSSSVCGGGPRPLCAARSSALVFAGLSGAAATAHLWAAAALLGAGVVLPALHIVEQCMAAMATIGSAVGTTQRVTPDG